METKYCPTCKEKINGNFCSECGAKGVAKVEVKGGIKSWYNEVQLSKVLTYPEVQTFIRSFNGLSKKSLSADQFIDVTEFLMSPVIGVSLKPVVDIAVPIYRQLGIKTSKTKTIKINDYSQVVFVKVLCSLVKNNLPPKEYHDAENGIIIVAEIPSSFKTFGGILVVSITSNQDTTILTVNPTIPGQIFDWGESKSIIKSILSDVDQIELDF